MLIGFRGRLCDFADDADFSNLERCFRYFEDGMLVVENGTIKDMGDYSQLSEKYGDELSLVDFGGKWIFPGFVDAHIHAVQTPAVVSQGKQLLDWLDHYIFPCEDRFRDPAFAVEHIRFFTERLLASGTTTAAIFCGIHDVTVEAVFETARQLNMRIIAGKTWMDRNTYPQLQEDPKRSYQSVIQQIERYHHQGRLLYSLNPRYALSSSPELLRFCGELVKHFPDLYVQTHIAENRREVEEVRDHFHQHRSYLDVYDSYGLLTPRTLLGHGIYLSEEEISRISETGSVVVHCPTSNTFLGSGLFPLHRMIEKKIRLAIGSDIGAGTSFSMLANLKDAYKISSLLSHSFPEEGNLKSTLHPLEAFYLITLGGAKALSLDNYIGNFSAGKEADFVVLNPKQNELLEYRLRFAEDLPDQLFAIMMLGDERIVDSVFLMGDRVYLRESTSAEC